MKASGYLTQLDLAECWDTVNLDFFSRKRILVTGATGCIGGGIAEAIASRLEELEGTELLVTGRRIGILERRFPQKNVRHASIDLANFSTDFTEKFDIVIHAASPASPKDYLKRPVDTMLINAQGIQQLMARNLQDDGRILYISSGEIYGNVPLDCLPVCEDYSAPTDPLTERACYIEAKRFCESLLLAYCRQYGFNAVISRPVHVYGPGLLPDDGRAMCDFAAKAYKGEDIIMYSDGTAQRAFCYLSDATRLHLKLISEGNSGEAYNVGRDDCVLTINELVESVVRTIAPVQIKRLAANYVAGSPQRLWPSMEKSRTKYGYQAKVNIDEGLRRLVDFWKNENIG